ncbi:hypothetical protein VN12_16095 [Pirellula sp. SH-Sr6A]|nr:hypothetical protein VN12_16095 [Pirellula sp. SH-Sr6A]
MSHLSRQSIPKVGCPQPPPLFRLCKQTTAPQKGGCLLSKRWVPLIMPFRKWVGACYRECFVASLRRRAKPPSKRWVPAIKNVGAPYSLFDACVSCVDKCGCSFRFSGTTRQLEHTKTVASKITGASYSTLPSKGGCLLSKMWVPPIPFLTHAFLAWISAAVLFALPGRLVS